MGAIHKFPKINWFFNYLAADGTVRQQCTGYDTSALRADSGLGFVEWTAEVAMVLLTFQPRPLPREWLPDAIQCFRIQLQAGSLCWCRRKTASLRVTVNKKGTILNEVQWYLCVIFNCKILNRTFFILFLFGLVINLMGEVSLWIFWISKKCF